MTTAGANGVTLGVEHFGDAAAPLVLCAGGTTMLSWPDALCASVARGGRHVVRYDLRDCGASSTVDPGGRRDPFFPVGNGQALAREIPGARLLVLERASRAIPDAAAGQVATAMLNL